MAFYNLFLWLLGLIYVGTCLWLIMVVLLQEGKSGGLAGSEGGSQAPGALTDTFGAGGAQKTLFNATSWGAGIFFVLAIVLTLLGNAKERTGGNLELEDGAPVTATTTPADAPVNPATTTTVPVTPAESTPASTN